MLFAHPYHFAWIKISMQHKLYGAECFSLAKKNCTCYGMEASELFFNVNAKPSLECINKLYVNYQI